MASFSNLFQTACSYSILGVKFDSDFAVLLSHQDVFLTFVNLCV